MAQVLIQEFPAISAVTYHVFADNAKENEVLRNVSAHITYRRIMSVPDDCLGSAEQLLAAIDERTHE